VRAIASLFPEEVHLIASRSAGIRTIEDLRGKRVSIGAPNSGTAVTARAILAAYHIKRVHISGDTADAASQKLEARKIDAFFFVGGAPVPLVEALISGGHAQLIPIGGAARDRLIAQSHGLSAETISDSAYGRADAVPTVGVQALWIVNDQEPADVVYSLARALFDRSNRATLYAGPHSAQVIALDRATVGLSAPLHPGAARFYKEAGKLP
jgi:TRAP transporter TAXI family solute receptor